MEKKVHQPKSISTVLGLNNLATSRRPPREGCIFPNINTRGGRGGLVPKYQYIERGEACERTKSMKVMKSGALMAGSSKRPVTDDKMHSKIKPDKVLQILWVRPRCNQTTNGRVCWTLSSPNAEAKNSEGKIGFMFGLLPTKDRLLICNSLITVSSLSRNEEQVHQPPTCCLCIRHQRCPRDKPTSVSTLSAPASERTSPS
jgi:hypothetical protein